jgi:hypothetical protein
MAGVGAEDPRLVAGRGRRVFVRLRHDVLAIGDPAGVSFGRARRIVHGTISEKLARRHSLARRQRRWSRRQIAERGRFRPGASPRPA